MDAHGRAKYWMRAMSFSSLTKLFQHMSAIGGVHSLQSVLDWNNKSKILVTADGRPVARTPIYHALFALQQFGPIRKVGGGYEADPSHWAYPALISNRMMDGDGLSLEGRIIYADLILLNKDCRAALIDLTGVPRVECTLDCFLAFACPIKWSRQERLDGMYAQVRSQYGEIAYQEGKAPHISVIHGLRYWLRDEVRIMDEYFNFYDGITLYPCLPDQMPPAKQLATQILKLVGDEEWTLLSISDLLSGFAVVNRWPRKWLFAAINAILAKAPGYAAAINASPGFLTLSAKGDWQKEFELRSYPEDKAGRLITHVKLHKRVKDIYERTA